MKFVFNFRFLGNKLSAQRKENEKEIILNRKKGGEALFDSNNT